jgi:transposase InsO family protein
MKAEKRFGPKKLRWWLQRHYPRQRCPSVRTLARWLKGWGKVRKYPHRARRGPQVRLAGRLQGRQPNDVWTADLKGSFPTRQRQRVTALTVRDLATRAVLTVYHVGNGGEQPIAAVMQRLFRRLGLPKAIRTDNGSPFGALGPRGWSRLAVGWVKLGIRLEYGRPRSPQDNAEHEQMHRLLKEHTTRPPSVSLAAQQRRFERWRQWYNRRRPHESLGQQLPAQLYRPSKRRWRKAPTAWRYPAHWLKLRLDAKGRWQWRQRQRLIGQAFARETLGARILNADTLAVYFRSYLVGTLHAGDLSGLRPVQWRPKLTKAGGLRPPVPSRSL